MNLETSESFQIQTISEGTIMNNYATSDAASGTLALGTADNVRWQIAGVNTGSGTFSLIVRQGNDTSNSPSILETFNDLSLDPFQPNYIERVIGNTTHEIAQDGADYYVKSTGDYVNRSKYISVKSVLTPTPNFFNNAGGVNSGSAGTLYSKFIPVASSGSFTGVNWRKYSGINVAS